MVFRRELELHSQLDEHDGYSRTRRIKKLAFIRDIGSIIVVAMALAVMTIVIFDKNSNENELEKNFEDYRKESQAERDSLKQELADYRAERAADDIADAQREECVARYDDIRESFKFQQLTLIGEFVVLITLIPPGTPERLDTAQEKVKELDPLNRAAREAQKAKIDYDNAGRPLPCPLPPTIPEEVNVPTDIPTVPEGPVTTDTPLTQE